MVEITLKNINKKFGNKRVITDLNLEVRSGELVALLGPSGCGKTTTLKILAGLIKPEEGDILFNKSSVLDLPTEQRGAVMVFQDYLLFPHMNIADNISFGLKMRGVGKDVRGERVKKLLRLVNLEGYDKHYPHELSGGQRQRVALARALAINPDVLLLDEPLSNLDTNLRGEMRDLIKHLHAEEKMTTLLVTHDQEEAMFIADRIALMKDGQIEQYGTPEELYKFPRTKYVADFFGRANYLKGIIENGRFQFAGGNLPIHDRNCSFKFDGKEGAKVEVMIKPEFIEIHSTKKMKGDKLYFPGRIVEKRFGGERIVYKIKIEEGLLEVITLPQMSFDKGEEVFVSISENNIWFLEGKK